MEPTPDISRYSYLWTTEAADWALLNVDPDVGDRPRYLITNTKDKSALIIENDATSQAVKDEMRRKGCRVIETVPSPDAHR